MSSTGSCFEELDTICWTVQKRLDPAACDFMNGLTIDELIIDGLIGR